MKIATIFESAAETHYVKRASPKEEHKGYSFRENLPIDTSPAGMEEARKNAEAVVLLDQLFYKNRMEKLAAQELNGIK